MITEIITWTNTNQGFVTAIFSALALVFSGISVWIAIKALKSPYKKSLLLKVETGTKFFLSEFSVGPDEPFISVTAVNNGNRTICLNDLCIYCHKMRLVPVQNYNINKPIAPGEVIEVQYSPQGVFENIRNNSKKFFLRRWYGYARDTEGRIYKARAKSFIKRVSQLYTSEYST